MPDQKNYDALEDIVEGVLRDYDPSEDSHEYTALRVADGARAAGLIAPNYPLAEMIDDLKTMAAEVDEDNPSANLTQAARAEAFRDAADYLASYLRRTPKVGDVVHDVRDFDDIPVGTVITDKDGDYALATVDGWAGDAAESVTRLHDTGPWRVQYVPGGGK